MLIYFLLVLSSIANIVSYYVHRKITVGLARQSIVLEKYERQERSVRGNLMNTILQGDLETYGEEQTPAS